MPSFLVAVDFVGVDEVDQVPFHSPLFLDVLARYQVSEIALKRVHHLVVPGQIQTVVMKQVRPLDPSHDCWVVPLPSEGPAAVDVAQWLSPKPVSDQVPN